MYPIICTIGPISIYSYGVTLAIAVIVCSFLLSRDAHRLGISSDVVFDFVFWVVVSGIFGARAFFVLLNFQYFAHNPFEIIMIHKGGLAWQGSLIAGSVAAFFYIRKRDLPLWKFLDVVAPYAALGQAIGRLGCFLNGCCYGKEAAWGIYFPVHHATLIPAQLFDALGLFLIFLLLKGIQKNNQVSGRVFVLYLLLASAQRFVIEFFRADHDIVWLGLSIFQWVCLTVITSAFYVHTRLKSR